MKRGETTVLIVVIQVTEYEPRRFKLCCRVQSRKLEIELRLAACGQYVMRRKVSGFEEFLGDRLVGASFHRPANELHQETAGALRSPSDACAVRGPHSRKARRPTDRQRLADRSR